MITTIGLANIHHLIQIQYKEKKEKKRKKKFSPCDENSYDLLC